MSKNAAIAARLKEKAAAGWFGGANSFRNPWVLPDTQYVWGINIVNRGGFPQVRPGYRMRLTQPPGNLQGYKIFRVTLSDAPGVNQFFHVYAVEGSVYAIKVDDPTPSNWEPYRLKNISFDPSAPMVVLEIAEKEVARSTDDTIRVLPTYSVMMMQDGRSPAAYWDGLTNVHLDENKKGTPIGLWMKYAGGRLWVGRANTVIASDLLDPISFTERTKGSGRADFQFPGDINGFALSNSTDTRQSNLLVFTNETTSSLLSSILDREQWQETPNFQTLLYSNLGCVAGRSIVPHAGLLWWYSSGGLVNSDSATAAFLTSQIKYRDMEMAFTKRQLASDLSGICSSSFLDFLLMSVPAGEVLNRHTMVLDYAVANELIGSSEPAWCGPWTGTRPVQWDTAIINGRKRCFFASVDFFALPGETSQNHIWEAFQADRFDSYEVMDAANAKRLIQNRIYCSFESKQFGDGMDLKSFYYAEVDAIEIAGDVDFLVSYATTRGGYQEILRKKVIATIDQGSSSSEKLAKILSAVKLRPQSRRLRTRDESSDPGVCDEVESPYTRNIGRSFSMLIQWCGRAGIDSLRLFTGPFSEPATGSCEHDETGIRAVTEKGTAFLIEDE